MIYVDMNGRCGNQFFQYAFARKLSMLNGDMPMTIDFFNVERWREKTGFGDFCNQLNEFRTVDFQELIGNGDCLTEHGTKKQIGLRRSYQKARAASERTGLKFFANAWQGVMRKNGVYRDDEFKIVPGKCRTKDIFVRGYFEDPAYFADMHDLLVEEFTPVRPPKEKNAGLYEVINGKESVCVSLRAWNDIKDDAKETAKRDVCSFAYYKAAFEKMKELHPDAVFVIFSNDIAWARENLGTSYEFYFEDGTDEIWEKMRMMYSCKHFIMSTSTFCWWAQYLCRDADKTVIAPDRWTNDSRRKSKLLMDDWIKIQT